jgi:hypothetical protein
MDAVAIVIAALAGLAILALAIRLRASGREGTEGTRVHADAEPHRVRAAAEAEMEEHDIDDMLDAINERRRRRGRRDIGEELSDELLRGSWDE